MFCSQCEGEYREGITVCPECGLPLVEELQEPVHDLRDLVTVFATADPALLPVARSLLAGTDIPFTIKGEETLGLFPGAGVGLAIDPNARAAQIQVPPTRADEARELLQELATEEETTDD